MLNIHSLSLLFNTFIKTNLNTFYYERFNFAYYCITNYRMACWLFCIFYWRLNSHSYCTGCNWNTLQACDRKKTLINHKNQILCYVNF